MRVVHICKVTGHTDPATHLLDLLPGLHTHGIDVHMLVLAAAGSGVRAFCAAMVARGVPVEVFSISTHVDPRLTRRIAAYLRQRRPDIVHTHLNHADLYGLAAAGMADVPYTITTRHNDNRARGNPFFRMANRRAMRRADHVIAVSQALADEIHITQPTVIHYGLPPFDEPPQAMSTDAPLVGYFGPLTERTGVDTLIRAFTQINAGYPTARLVIGGEGGLLDDLQVLGQAEGLGDAIRFTARADERLMAACTVIAVPARWVGGGMAALRAMRCGVPVVASRVGALAEIVVDQRTGWLVPVDYAAGFAGRIEQMLGDPKLAAGLGANGRDRLITHFTAAHMVGQTVTVYEKVSHG